MVFAHALSGVELPLPVPALIGLSTGAVVALAGRLSARAASGHDLPTPAAARPQPTIASLRALRTLGPAVGLALTAALVVTAAFGPDRPALNPAARWLFVGFYGGLVPASLLLGAVWRPLNPLRALSGGLAWLIGDRDEATARPLPDAVGLWPAAAGLAAFGWCELIAVPRPSTVLAFLALYTLVHLGAALVYGRDWYGCGEAFEAYSAMLGRLSPLQSGIQGFRLRNPVSAAAATPPTRGLLGLVAVVVGATLYDLVQATVWFELTASTFAGGGQLAFATAGLAAAIVTAGLALRIGVIRPFLAVATVPVAAGYALAHHIVALLAALPAGFVAAIQWVAFVGGHLGAVAVGHRITIARFDPRTARAVQFPLRAVLVASVAAGIWLWSVPA